MPVYTSLKAEVVTWELKVAPPIRPLEPTTKIKPSEAVKLGRLKYPTHVRHTVFGSDFKSACFIGAMFAGYGMTPFDCYSLDFDTFHRNTGLSGIELRDMAARFDVAANTYDEERNMIAELEARGL